MKDRRQVHRDDAPAILKRFEGLRVTDVCDGMDALRMHDIGQMSHDIRPLWRDVDKFTHRVYGIAHTVRFVPTDKPVPAQSPDEFYEWMSEWYRTLAQGPITDTIKPGDVIVIDGFECGTVGFIGSNNSLSWIAAGAVGVVTNGGGRGNEEGFKEKSSGYSPYIFPNHPPRGGPWPSRRPARSGSPPTRSPIRTGCRCGCGTTAC